MTEHVVLRRRLSDDGVLWLTKDDPATGNALTLAMAGALDCALRAAADDSQIRAVVLDAAGNGFHGGAALVGELRDDPMQLDAADVERILAIGQGLAARLAALDVPVIGIARAGALGGGLELLVRSDFLFCLDTARFTLPEVRFGFVAAFGGLSWAARALPQRRAQEMLLLGRSFDGRAAAETGIVTRSFADDSALNDYVATTLADLRCCSPAALREAKRGLRALWGPAGKVVERAAQHAAMASGNFRAGLAAAAAGGRYDYVAGTIVARL